MWPTQQPYIITTSAQIFGGKKEKGKGISVVEVQIRAKANKSHRPPIITIVHLYTIVNV